jgi:uncharacterized membrane protein YdjX (TVP38/TMEM64 family)
MGRVSRALARHGIMAMMLLRLTPVAPFAVVNLVAGAGRARFGDFMVGTLFGMAPGIFAMSVLGECMVAVLRRPDVINIVVLAAATALVIAAGLALARRLARAAGSGRGQVQGA